MNGIDLSTASDIRLGGTTVSAVYLGSTLIWPATHNYANDYFTIEAIESGTLHFILASGVSRVTIYYSLDNGSSWIQYNISPSLDNTLISLNAGQKIKVKGTNSNLNYQIRFRDSNDVNSLKKYNVYGNVFSLMFDDDFKDFVSLPSQFELVHLFYHSYIVDASNLVLPSTVLIDIGLSNRGYGCYSRMFENCTQLLYAPALPATSLVPYCYSYMFDGCTSLVNAPVLPASNLASHCYEYMFRNCTSLVNAPVLPASTLTEQCYGAMFYNCSSLNNITCLATDISASYCTGNWVNGVASVGTFTKEASMTDWTTGNSGIPSGWTVQDA